MNLILWFAFTLPVSCKCGIFGAASEDELTSVIGELVRRLDEKDVMIKQLVDKVHFVENDLVTLKKEMNGLLLQANKVQGLEEQIKELKEMVHSQASETNELNKDTADRLENVSGLQKLEPTLSDVNRARRKLIPIVPCSVK